MEKHPHYGHRARVRDRVRMEGLDHFQDYQVLEYALSFVIPYKDTNPIAHALIDKFGSLASVLEADEESIKEVEGMGEVSANFLTSIIKIYNFYERHKDNNFSTISNVRETYLYAKKLFVGKLQEEIYIVCLSPNNKIVHTEKISQGNSSKAQITIRKITDIMSRCKVSNIIIAHNHPKGTSQPSADDNKITKALVVSLAINDSFLLDHIIIGENGYYSYRKEHKIEEFSREVEGFMSNQVVAQNRAKYEV